MLLSCMTSSPNWSLPTNAFMSPHIYHNPAVSNITFYYDRKMCQEAVSIPDKI